MKNSKLQTALSKFEEALQLGAFPTVCVKNITTLKKSNEVYKKESDSLTKSFSTLKEKGESEDKDVYESYVYLSFDGGRSIQPLFEDEAKTPVVVSQEKIQELEEKQKDNETKLLFIGYSVEPTRFEEYVKSYNELAESESTEDVKIFTISEEQMTKAENENKITGELVLFFNEAEYYIFD